MAVGDPDMLAGTLDGGEAVGLGLGEAEADADGEPLGKGVRRGVGLGLGDGKSVVGTFATESAKIRTKRTTTTTTQIFARLSSRGGSDPR